MPDLILKKGAAVTPGSDEVGLRADSSGNIHVVDPAGGPQPLLREPYGLPQTVASGDSYHVPSGRSARVYGEIVLDGELIADGEVTQSLNDAVPTDVVLMTIPAGTSVTIETGFQRLIVGEMVLDGELIADGEIVQIA